MNLLYTAKRYEFAKKMTERHPESNGLNRQKIELKNHINSLEDEIRANHPDLIDNLKSIINVSLAKYIIIWSRGDSVYPDIIDAFSAQEAVDKIRETHVNSKIISVGKITEEIWK